MKDLKIWTENKYKKLYKKYVNSRAWFIFLNVLAFTMVALMIVLNLYAIKKNKFDDTKVYYVALAILTGFIGLMTSIISFFTLNKKSNMYKEQYKGVLNEYHNYKNKDGIYSESKSRDGVLIDEVLKIINEE